MTWDWLVRRPIAIALGVYPSSFTAFITAARVFSEILVLGTSLTTKETVVCETPERRATSPIVGRFLFLFIALLIRFTKSNYHQGMSKSQARYALMLVLILKDESTRFTGVMSWEDKLGRNEIFFRG